MQRQPCVALVGCSLSAEIAFWQPALAPFPPTTAAPPWAAIPPVPEAGVPVKRPLDDHSANDGPVDHAAVDDRALDNDDPADNGTADDAFNDDRAAEAIIPAPPVTPACFCRCRPGQKSKS